MRKANPELYRKNNEEAERRALGYVPARKVEVQKSGNDCHCTSQNLCEVAMIAAQKIREDYEPLHG